MNFFLSVQKQPPEVLCNKRSCQIFRKIHREIPVPESLYLTKLDTVVFNFVKKEALTQGFFYEFCKISENASFNRTVPGNYCCRSNLEEMESPPS